jgi:Uma2 family endonuclease
MEAVTTLPQGRPLMADDLALMPDDGHRYELIDGVLVVTPSPTLHHQRAVTRLWQLLDDSCPDTMETLVASFDVRLDDFTVLIPDVLVARRSDLTDANLPTAPVLAVEVLSPSTRRLDLTLKKARLEAAGCEHYWVLDPRSERFIGWRLVDEEYVEVADARGDELVAIEVPFPVHFSPAQLLR